MVQLNLNNNAPAKLSGSFITRVLNLIFVAGILIYKTLKNAKITNIYHKNK